MNRFSYLFIFLSIVLVFSCSKDEEATVYSEPIAVLQPSTNPANIVKGQTIKYDVRFTNDEYIDSIMVYFQIDSTNMGYNQNKDSLINKIVYFPGNQENEQSLSGSYLPPVFPNVGDKMYLVFRMRSKSRFPEKRVTLSVN